MATSFEIDDRTLRDVSEIRRLLGEAYEHWQANCPDLHSKSSEGAVSVDMAPWFWKEENANSRPGVSVYSYVLGPSRSHYFDDSSEALTAVRKWHEEEMKREYTEEFW